MTMIVMELCDQVKNCIPFSFLGSVFPFNTLRIATTGTTFVIIALRGLSWSVS